MATKRKKRKSGLDPNDPNYEIGYVTDEGNTDDEYFSDTGGEDSEGQRFGEAAGSAEPEEPPSFSSGYSEWAPSLAPGATSARWEESEEAPCLTRSFSKLKRQQEDAVCG